ncbi:MAG: FAD binding domain-containing protein [Elusimicrobia bacterium]|nr:FAD binding domain-containing protein [Elusimicrobiota bacterium]
MKKFDYFRPQSLKELFSIYDENSAILAGGTDLLVDLRSGKKSFNKVIDIKGIEEFYGIRKANAGVEIGACETFSNILNSKILNKFTALKQAAGCMGCYEIRNRATIGGNICNSSPGCETGVVLSVYEATVNVCGKNGKRKVPFEEFCVGVNKTSLKRGEVVLSIFIPEIKNSKSFYSRISRTQGMDLACWNGAILVINPENPRRRKIRMSFGTVAPTPFRDKEVEKNLSNKKLTQKDIDMAFEEICKKISPRASSLRATPEEKKLAIKNFMNDILGNLP